MTLEEFLSAQPVQNADIAEMLRRNEAEILYFKDGNLAVHNRVSGLNVLGGNDEEELEKAFAALPQNGGGWMAHGDKSRAFLTKKLGFRDAAPCRQAAYLKEELPQQIRNDVEIRVLDESFLDKADKTYGTPHRREYIAGRIAAGELIGAFVHGSWAGFIGRHAEGSIGMLEVFPEFRRQGLGYLLEVEAMRRTKEAGALPYCHIYYTNEKSMNLQKKIGYTFADELVYWMS